MSNVIANISHRISFTSHADSGNGLHWAALIVPALLSYTALCSLLRFRRRNAMQKKFNYPDVASLSRMTNVDAQEIIQYLSELEFPLVYVRSLQFALFKVSHLHTQHRDSQNLIIWIDLWHSHHFRAPCVHERVHY